MVTVTLEYLDKDNEGNPTWVPEVIEIDADSDFTLNDDAIDFEMSRVGRLLQFYGNLSAEMKAQAARKKQEVEWIYNEVYLDEKNKATAAKERVTENALRAVIMGDQEYRTTQMRYIVAEKDASKVDHFYRSMLKKADVCIAVCYKQKAEVARGAM
jgi:hypothetical protein